MTNRYKKSILNLLNILHQARIEPYENVEKWLTLQEKLINKLCYVEQRVRNCKAEIKNLNFKRKNPPIQLKKDESLLIKEKIKSLKYKIEEYNRVITILKSIGDGIAFTFIDKFDIKPQNAKESAGFISGKKGLKLEKKYLKKLYNEKIITILNDITSVLKYADLTIITDFGLVPIEVKSSKLTNNRIKRQNDKANTLYDYLTKDITYGLYDNCHEVMVRVESENSEINYINRFNEVVATAERKGFEYVRFEEGFSCFVSFQKVEDIVFELKTKELGLTEPIHFYLNVNKFKDLGYYPFSLSFFEPKHYWDFLEGQLHVIMFIDFCVIKRISINNGYSVKQLKHENWAFSFKNLDPNSDAKAKEIRISKHYFCRSFMEFVSVKWLIKESFNMPSENQQEQIIGYNRADGNY